MMDAASASTEISGRRAFQLDAMTPQRFDERLGEVIRCNDAAGGDTEEVAAERGCVILPDAKHLYSQSLEKSQERCVGQDLIIVAESGTTHIDISGEERFVVRCCVKSVAGQGHQVAVDDVQVCVEVHLTLLVPSADSLQSHLRDSIAGTWKLSKQGREVWESYPWILEIREDSTFTLRYTPYQKPEWLEREGTYFFPNGANIWDSPYNGARVFEIEFVVPGVVFETPQRFTCYYWPDSMRLYDVYNINVFDLSHLYLRVKENE